MAVALGIDVGTTAVKCALVDTLTRTQLSSASEETETYVDCGVGRAEQRVDVILRAVQTALRKLAAPQLGEISSIGICGQMHGIVWWRAADVGQAVADLLAGHAEEPTAWSRLVTWEDQRCSKAFLTECNRRVDAATTGSPSSGLASGYGLATYAHTLETDPSSLAAYDTCGTIHDLLSFLLCGHSSPEGATIDTTNACSWGGFNMETKDWKWAAVAALGIPHNLLPRVKTPGCIIGHTSASGAFGLPANIRVFVPMGDHPCSVVAAIAHQQDLSDQAPLSLVNIGTSAQLALILPHHAAKDLVDSPTSGFEIRPFITNDQVLGVAAALSGGNMFAWLVRRCQQWTAELTDETSASPPTNQETSAVYERLIRLGLDKVETDLEFSPTLNGERTNPTATGHIDALRLHNASLGDLSASLCRGLVRNLVALVPKDLDTHFRASRVIGTGNALVRNALLQHFLSQELRDGANLTLQAATDAAVGAALTATVLNLS